MNSDDKVFTLDNKIIWKQHKQMCSISLLPFIYDVAYRYMTENFDLIFGV